VFSGGRDSGFNGGDAQRRDMEAFMMAFDSDLAPVVGQQVTLRSDNAAAVGPRIDLLIQRARMPFVSKILGGNSTECDLVAKVRVGDRVRGYFLDGQGRFVPDDNSPVLSDAELRQLVAGSEVSEVTYTAVPPGSGVRIGVDRDLDGQFDGGGSLPSGPRPTGCSCQVGAAPEAGRGLGLLTAGLLVLGLALRRRSKRSRS
jgi:MYXO-CTERM domain-containing protein